MKIYKCEHEFLFQFPKKINFVTITTFLCFNCGKTWKENGDSKRYNITHLK